MSYPWLQFIESEFTERLRGDRLAHALLLAGPADCGKVELARGFMAAALCLEKQYPACGECRSCRLARGGAHPDGHIVTIEENPKTGKMRNEVVIEQVRRLSAALCLTNTVSLRKAALLFPAEAMNKSTANALLKSLEEPPGEAAIILVSHDPARLLPTIRSRCQRLDVRLPGTEAALAWLTREARCTDEQARLALEAAAGRPLRARRMLSDGGIEQFASLRGMLDGLADGRVAPQQAYDELSGIEPERLWSWISLRAAAETRDAAGRGGDARSTAGLQSQADRNRGLVSTPVRQDFLLRDWLIQWARLKR